MKKKAIFLAFMLLVIPIFSCVPAYAGKGSDKLYYEMNVDLIVYGPPVIRTAPPEGAPPNVVFMTLTEVDSVGFRLQIGSEMLYPDRSAVVEVIRNVKQSFILAKVTETYTFAGVDGSIELSLIGRINNYGTPDAMSEMNVVGHGTGYFEGVKIKAEGHNEEGNIDHKIHIGTIMGWTGLPP